MRNIQNKISKKYFWMILIIIIYLSFRLLNLVGLPVFADEAIYIRWSQLILDNGWEYVFFPVNDGKTALFIWQLVPFLAFNFDPLWMARFLSVLGGLFQLLILLWIAKQFHWSKASLVFLLIFVTVIPYWFFHHRMALMDGWLSVWISLIMALQILYLNTIKKDFSSINLKTLINGTFTNKRLLLTFIFSVISIASALLTKVPAVLAFPALVLTPLLIEKVSKKSFLLMMVMMTQLILGSLLAGLTLLHPTGPQLFARGSDFLLPLGEVLAGRWRETLPSIPTHLGYFWHYVGASLFALIFYGFYRSDSRKLTLILVFQAVLFMAPIWLLGKMVYPRYLFPALIWLSLAGAYVFQFYWLDLLTFLKKSSLLSFFKKSLIIFISFAILHSFLVSFQFLWFAWTNADKIPFVGPDATQYLQSWSSGHGIRETYELALEWLKKNPEKPLFLATEGRFGTLPDGLLMYNFPEPGNNLTIEGTGSTLISEIPKELIGKASANTTFWLIVNTDRLSNPPIDSQLLAQFCRPNSSPCLQVWSVPTKTN